MLKIFNGIFWSPFYLEVPLPKYRHSAAFSMFEFGNLLQFKRLKCIFFTWVGPCEKLGIQTFPNKVCWFQSESGPSFRPSRAIIGEINWQPSQRSFSQKELLKDFDICSTGISKSRNGDNLFRENVRKYIHNIRQGTIVHDSLRINTFLAMLG